MSFFAWIEQSALSVWVRESPSLLGFPAILFLHTLGLAMLAGVSVAIDLWLLRAHRFAHTISMKGLFSVMWLGFGINAVSGLLLLVAYPAKALTDPVFYLKLALIAGALVAVSRINAAMFAGGTATANAAITPAAKRWAVASLVLWAGTILAGRLLAYTARVLMSSELA